jgi:hypothetical protein
VPFYKVSKTSGNVLAFPSDLGAPRVGRVVHETDKRLGKRERKAAARAWIAVRTKVYGEITWTTSALATVRSVKLTLVV